MEKKLLIKKIVFIAVCIVLVVVSCIMFFDFDAINVGEGNGTNARITSMRDMGEMLEAFSPQLNGYNFSADISELSNDENDVEQHVGKYKSVTFSEESSAYVNLDFAIKDNKSRTYDGSSTATYHRFMQVYITENATYYHSECTVTTDGSMPEYIGDNISTSTSYSDITLNIDVFIAKDRVLLRINKALIAVNGVNNYMFERVLGRWGDFTEDVAEGKKIVSEFNSVNRMNFRILALMGECISGYNSDNFNNNGSSYSLKKGPFRSLASSLLSIAGVPSYLNDKGLSGEFEVDLGDDTNPIVDLTLENKYKLDKETAQNSNYTKLNFDYLEYDEFTFSAINNTVIKGYNSISALSAKDYTELLMEGK